MKQIGLIAMVMCFVMLHSQAMKIDFSAPKNSPHAQFTEQMVTLVEGACGCTSLVAAIFCESSFLTGLGSYLCGSSFTDVVSDEYDDPCCDAGTCCFSSILTGLCCYTGQPEGAKFFGGLAASSGARVSLKMVRQKLRKEKTD